MAKNKGIQTMTTVGCFDNNNNVAETFPPAFGKLYHVRDKRTVRQLKAEEGIG